MANDHDMLEDVAYLKFLNKHEQSRQLDKIYTKVFIDNDRKTAEKLKEQYIAKYGSWWGEYWA